MIEIRGRRFPNERDLYAAEDIKLVGCAFDGAEDGESALKEARNVSLENCFMNLRYPLWHDEGVTLSGCTMSENCRAALWYSTDIRVTDSKLHGIKERVFISFSAESSFERSEFQGEVFLSIRRKRND